MSKKKRLFNEQCFVPSYRPIREFFTYIETSGEILMNNFMLHESLTFTEIILY